ncbi:MAG: tRNA 4-thiouridine(8) synthase ThiI [Deltaproteobacteria bacterium]|nr:tRNA 4-thiouridine(8) synthase ThiI [Deltaproteobacteria bacterium]MBW2414798.1 tRNA 4-thiouridine(8) synthase ThiI [Deltaproteobacteria bacterium]
MQYVVHYAEVGLKGRNRPRFEARLRTNLERALRPLGPVQVRRLYGRLLAEVPDEADPAEVRRRVSGVFGVAWFGRATVTDPSLEAIEQAVDRLVGACEFSSFGVRSRRVDKRFPMRSSDLNAHLGARVVEATGARVDLNQPDLWIEPHILSDCVLLPMEKIPGPGGLPVGTGGKAVALISGGIDSPVAAWAMARRGLELYYVHFHSAPFTSSASQQKVRDVVRLLAWSQRRTTLFLVPFGELQQVLVRDAPAEPRIVLYRRFMLRVAERLAERTGSLALITGDSLGQVSSQTLGNLDTINRAASLPVLRPLIEMDKSEIIRRAQEIGTYETSIEPDEDCCSYLMPRQPATWTRPDPIEAIENKLDVKGMVEDALERVEHERIEPTP